MNKVNVLWTGGYDSTFRMIQLSKLDIDIQPYYLRDDRISEKNELNAIKEITNDIKNHTETKARILPLIIHNTLDIKSDKQITSAYHDLNKLSRLGSQYEWLPRFAKEHNIDGLELSIEKSAFADTPSGARATIDKFGQVELKKDRELEYYVINREKSNKDLVTLFNFFHFPSPLFKMTKQEMLIEYEKLGFKNVVNKTWFCFNPINGEPCGVCNPCKSTLNEGMTFRFTEAGLRRNKYIFTYKVFRKIKNLLSLS